MVVAIEQMERAVVEEAIEQMDGAVVQESERTSLNAKKKLKKKEREKAKKQAAASVPPKKAGAQAITSFPPDDDVVVEYVADAMVDESDPNYVEWIKIFEKFQKKPEVEVVTEEVAEVIMLLL